MKFSTPLWGVYMLSGMIAANPVALEPLDASVS